MTDVEKLRQLALDGDFYAIQELIDRIEAAESARRDDYQNWMTALDRNAELLAKLEAAEKELAELRSSMKFRTSLIGRTEAERDALRAKIEQMEQQEPVGWQTRTRPTWNDGTWGQWSECSEEYAQDIKKTPLLHDWLYEARALYALPGAKGE